VWYILCSIVLLCQSNCILPAHPKCPGYPSYTQVCTPNDRLHVRPTHAHLAWTLTSFIRVSSDRSSRYSIVEFQDPKQICSPHLVDQALTTAKPCLETRTTPYMMPAASVHTPPKVHRPVQSRLPLTPKMAPALGPLARIPSPAKA
jgi:hypothetical protein